MNASEFPKNLKDYHPSSSIVRHLIESGHKVEPNKAVSLLYEKIVEADYSVS